MTISELLFGDSWQPVDASWDSGIVHAGFPLHEWNSTNGTDIAVPSTEIIRWDNLAQRSLHLAARSRELTEMQKQSQIEFYPKLNIWLNELREN